MRTFLLRLALFALLMLALDIAVGFVPILHNPYIGVNNTTARKAYIANEMTADVVFLGSSRSFRHYAPDIIEDSLGMTAYNAGFDGSGLFAAYGYYKIFTQRYMPKVIVLDINVGQTLLHGNKFNDLDQHLRHFYDRPGIDSLYLAVSPEDYYKMHSSLYRLNTVLTEYAHDFHCRAWQYEQGWLPVDKEMGKLPPRMRPRRVFVYDALRLHYLERWIRECEGKTTLVYAASPSFRNMDDCMFEIVETMCARYNVPFICHYTDSTFNFNPDYFYDRTHMTRKGARAYTAAFAHDLKTILNGDSLPPHSSEHRLKGPGSERFIIEP